MAEPFRRGALLSALRPIPHSQLPPELLAWLERYAHNCVRAGTTYDKALVDCITKATWYVYRGWKDTER